MPKFTDKVFFLVNLCYTGVDEIYRIQEQKTLEDFSRQESRKPRCFGNSTGVISEGISMKRSKVVCLLIALGWSFLGSHVGAFDVGWMQKGVRVWYFGGVGTGMSSDAEEAYLLGVINGANVPVTHYSGLNHWGSTNPVSTATYSRLDQGPCWIHPLVLQNLQIGDHRLGLEITEVTRSAYTYNTFLNTALPARNHFLPVKALFDLKPQRDLVNIVYKIDTFGSSGAACFDAETGLALYYNASSVSVTELFILSEINYDFARKRAFAEDDGPHTGFQS